MAERAFYALADFVNAHPKNFIRQAPHSNPSTEEYLAEGYETYGKVYLNGDVAFIPTQLTNIIETDLGFSSVKKMLTEWNDSGKLDSSADSVTRTQRISGKVQRVIYFKNLLELSE